MKMVMDDPEIGGANSKSEMLTLVHRTTYAGFAATKQNGALSMLVWCESESCLENLDL